MKIATILGSPRKNGNTAAVLRAFEDRLAHSGEVQRINLAEICVHGCLGCNACQRNKNKPGCVQPDDALVVFESLLKSDVIVYATPLYVWSFSAQMKALLDRQYCMVKWNEEKQSAHSLFFGKRVILLVTCGGSAEGDADLIQETFERAMAYAGCTVIGKFVVPGCTTPDQLGEKIGRTAIEMTKCIAGI